MMRSQNRFLVALLLAGSLAIAGCGGSSAVTVNVNKEPLVVDITTSQAIVRQIPTYFEATGNLASDAQTDVAASVGGKIVEVNFDVGSYVTQGSVLVRLDDRDARLRIEQAEAQAEQARTGVAQAIAALRQAQIRLNVKDGETFDIQTFSQVKSVKANLELAEKELGRAQRLYETGDISKAIVDQRRSQRDSLLGQLDEAMSNAAVAVRAINSAETAVAAARSAVATAETQVDVARKSLADTLIYAPISGYISERVADPGEFISPNTPNSKVATIMRTGTLRLKIDVPEQSIGKVGVGQGISLQVSAYPDRNFAGRVVRMLPNVNATARTLMVEAEIDNVDNMLKPGQFATVRITQSQPENAVMVPTSSIKTDGDTNKVYVVEAGAARERIVQLGLLENDMIQVKTGVSENEVVATSGLGELFDGVLVRQMN